MADFAVEHIETKTITTGDVSSYESVVSIEKHGAHYPLVPVVFGFTDGTTMRKVWEVDSDQIQYTIKHQAPLSWVMVDPLSTIVVENKRINNYMRAQVEEPVRTRIDWIAVKWIEAITKVLGW